MLTFLQVYFHLATNKTMYRVQDIHTVFSKFKLSFKYESKTTLPCRFLLRVFKK